MTNTLNRFCPLSKKTHPLFLKDNIKMDRIPTKIKWKFWRYLTVFLIQNFKIQPRSSISCCFYYQAFTSSADIVFCKFLELHSTLSEKNIFVTNFPFLMLSHQISHFDWSKRVSENWQSATDNQKWPSLGSELTTFIDGILSRLLFQLVKGRFNLH